MSILTHLFGSRRQQPPPASVSPGSHLESSTQAASASPANIATRRELLRVVLRDTLTRHGIPAGWIGAEVLTSTSRNGAHGVHWRLQVKHWDERLMVHSVALQNNLIKRLMAFDPMASSWLTGISWQFALADESMCPPLPPARVWTAEPKMSPWTVQPSTPGVVHAVEPEAVDGDETTEPAKL